MFRRTLFSVIRASLIVAAAGIIAYSSFPAPSSRLSKAGIAWDEGAATRWAVLGGSRRNPVPFVTSQKMDRRLCWSADRRRDDPQQPIVAVMAEHTDGGRLDNLLLTLRRLDYANVHIFGADLSNPDDARDWLPVRLARYRALVESLSPSRLVVFVDADMLFSGPPALLARRFGEFDRATVVFAASTLCDSLACRTFALHRFGGLPPEGFRFLDVNSMIGRASSLKWLLGEAGKLAREGSDEEASFTKVFAAYPDRIILDTNNRIFGISVTHQNRDFRSFSRNDSGILSKGSSEARPLVFRQHGLKRNPNWFSTACERDAAEMYNSIIGNIAHSEPSVPRPRIVVSLTSIPPRYPRLVETLQSLLNQSIPPDAIYLNVATSYAREFGDELDELPPRIAKLRKVTVNYCEDFGPATKIIPTLDLETDPETVIITADDDVAYHPEMIKSLVDAYRQWPAAAYGHSGQMIDMLDEFGPTVVSAVNHARESVPVDILEAYRGGLYKRGWFDDSVKRIRESRFEPCFRTDDIWISAHLAARGVPRIKLSENRPGAVQRMTENDGKGPLRTENLANIRRNDQCARYLLENFKLSWTQEPDLCPMDYQPIPPPNDEKTTTNNPRFRETMTSPCSPVAYVALNSTRRLQVGEIMRSGQSLFSPSGKFELHLGSKPMLCARKAGEVAQRCFPGESVSVSESSYLVFQPEGKLSIHAGSSPYVDRPRDPSFYSLPLIPESQLEGAELRIEDDGRFGIFGKDGSTLWGGGQLK